jgi:hypothetical protein
MFIEFRPNGLFVAIDGTKHPQVIEILEEANDGTPVRLRLCGYFGRSTED